MDCIKAMEEKKRERMFDPVKRWEAIQQMIAWAQENMPLHQRRNRPRTHPNSQRSNANL